MILLHCKNPRNITRISEYALGTLFAKKKKKNPNTNHQIPGNKFITHDQHRKIKGSKNLYFFLSSEPKSQFVILNLSPKCIILQNPFNSMFELHQTSAKLNFSLYVYF